MRHNVIRLASLLAIFGSAAIAAGPDEAVQTTPPTSNMAAHCDQATVLDLVFNPNCGIPQKPLPVAAKIAQPSGDLRVAKAKRITKMPWQTGIFQ